LAVKLLNQTTQPGIVVLSFEVQNLNAVGPRAAWLIFDF
jgi:hypothetical protein